MDVVFGNPAKNLEKVHQFVELAAKQGSDILVLPELWSTGYDLEQASQYATSIDKGIFAETAVLARNYHIQIVGSCLSTLTEDKFGNTAVFIDNDGKILADYSKVHLFQLMDEHHFLTAGETLSIVETHWGQAGLAICYDLRFPELFRQYALAGCVLTFLPAEWPHPRLEHWQTLLRARAIENQMFMVACNRVGNDKKSHFCGHSCLIDPWGKVLVEAGEEEGIFSAEIDLASVTAVRQTIPIFQDRRPSIYQKTIQQANKDNR